MCQEFCWIKKMGFLAIAIHPNVFRFFFLFLKLLFPLPKNNPLIYGMFAPYRMPLQFTFFMLSLAFLIVNLLCIFIGNGTDDQRRWIPVTRITFSNGLFAACSISLASNTYKIANMTPAHVYLESKVCCALYANLDMSSMGWLIFLVFSPLMLWLFGS